MKFQCYFVAFLLVCSASVFAEDKTTSGKEKSEWINLLAEKGLKNWKRIPLAPDTKLRAKNPWKRKRNVLICDGVDVKEMLLYKTKFKDGIYHLEWRFRKVKGMPEYNSGAYVRTQDGQNWYQVQLAHVKKRPMLGDIFWVKIVENKPQFVVIEGTGAKQARPPGQWNTYEITTKGKTIEVRVNGVKTCTWKDCPVEEGYVGLQSEFYYLEFRNLKFKPIKE